MLDQTFQRSFATSVHIVRFQQVGFSVIDSALINSVHKAGLTMHDTLCLCCFTLLFRSI